MNAAANTASPEQTAYDALVAAEAAHGADSPEFLAAYKALRAARAARAAANPRTTPYRSGPSGP
jgi:hypothetical protein